MNQSDMDRRTDRPRAHMVTLDESAGTEMITGPAAHEYGHFDFGLTLEQEERANRLHEASTIIDLHFQGPCSPDVWTEAVLTELDHELARRGSDLSFAWGFLHEKAVRGEFDLYRELYRQSGVTTGIVTCVLSDERQLLSDVYKASRTLSAFDWARGARAAEDILAAKAAGGIAFWGVCAYNLIRPDDLRLVDIAHELGVLNVVELAYNRMNFIGAGCTERYDPGLSHFGIQFVRRCNQVGVIVDTAHTGRQSTLDACETSDKPVIASHTSAAALYNCDRAKSDEELQAIAGSGGVIGVNAIPFFLGPPHGPTPTIELMLDHIDYLAQLVGWPHVAIGTDHPIALPTALQQKLLLPLLSSSGFREEHDVGLNLETTLIGFRDPRDLRNITRGLVARGYDDMQIRGILGENFLRVFQDVCG
jgi:membrane dipeptidase